MRLRLTFYCFKVSTSELLLTVDLFVAAAEASWDPEITGGHGGNSHTGPQHPLTNQQLQP